MITRGKSSSHLRGRNLCLSGRGTPAMLSHHREHPSTPLEWKLPRLILGATQHQAGRKVDLGHTAFTFKKVVTSIQQSVHLTFKNRVFLLLFKK